MKRTAFSVLLLLPCLLLPAKGGAFFASAGVTLLAPADSRFADLYGKLQVGPELRAGYTLHRGLYVWLGGSFISASGTLPVLEDALRASQMFLTLGGGGEIALGRRLRGDLHGALLLAGFKEKAMGATASKTAPGFEAGAALRFLLSQRFFLDLGLDYAGAWATVRTEAGKVDIVLGGLRLGARAGFRF